MATTKKQSAAAAFLLASCAILVAAQGTSSATEAPGRPVGVHVVVEPVSAAPEGSPALTALVTVTGLQPGARGSITVDYYGPLDELSDTSCSPERWAGQQRVVLDMLDVLDRDTVVGQGTAAPWPVPEAGIYAAKASYDGETAFSGDQPIRLSGVSACPSPDASVLVTDNGE